MKCTGDEWDHCRVEKMGCYGCYYNDIDIEKAKKKVELIEYKYTLTNNDDKAIETLLQYIAKLEQENNKQNKIIDAMANFILDTDYIKNNRSNEDYYIKCVEEIKQYFEKKVEEEKC